MSTIKFTVPVEVEVDLEDWCTAYGVTEQDARRDVEEHTAAMLADLLADALRQVANGSRLVGDLTSHLSDGAR